METTREMPKIDSKTLASYILYRYGQMSHLKLQKLVYFVEGYHLAYFNCSLVDDDFEAWAHGPVSRVLYNELKDKAILYGNIRYDLEEGETSPITILEEKLFISQIEIINEVIELYIAESGITLEGITHQQTPWIIARGDLLPHEKCSNKIDKQLMKEYFSNLIN